MGGFPSVRRRPPPLVEYSIDQPGDYEFELRVFDGHAFSPPSGVSFTVR